MIWKATYEVYKVKGERIRIQKVVLRGCFGALDLSQHFEEEKAG